MVDNTFIKAFIILLVAFSGLLVGVFLGHILQDSAIQLVLAIGFFLIVAAVYSAVRIYILKQRKILTATAGKQKDSEVGFVVDTFHELVGRLKEKEKELARLKSLSDEKAVRIEAYNENILQSVPSGVVSIDNMMRIKSFNQAAERILGIDAKDAIDRDFKEVFNEPLISLVREKETISRGEYPYVTRDNRHIWLGVTTSKLRNTAGESIGIIFIFTDLTNIKALQEQVKLKERLSQLGEMSAGISHELRNSMSVISGYAKLLNRKIESPSKAAVDSILTEIKNMDRIISELLAFAKPTVLNMTTVDLNTLIKETVTSLIGANDTIKVLFNTSGQVSVKADAVLLKHALTNIIINAIDSMPDGGSLEIESKCLRDKVVVSIKDTGYGIPEDIRDKVFLPFYTTKEKGTGLGLALVQKIIVSHGGSIEVDSQEGEGTTFRITLNVAS